MLDIKLLRQDLDAVVANLMRRGFKFDRERWLALEAQRKELQVEVESLRQTRNERSKNIGRAKAAGGDVEALKREVGEIGDALTAAEAKLATTSTQLDDFLAGLPNLLHESVPPGRDSSDNVELRRWGTPPKFAFTPLDHVALGEKLGLMDFDAAAKLAGARFVVLRGALARLQRALTQLMLDVQTQEHGYSETYVPYLVNDRTLFGTGQLPKFAADLFALDGRSEAAADPDGRGVAHEPRRRQHRRAWAVADAAHRAHAVLPVGGGLIRSRHARDDPSASVREGRARAHREPGRVIR